MIECVTKCDMCVHNIVCGKKTAFIKVLASLTDTSITLSENKGYLHNGDNKDIGIELRCKYFDQKLGLGIGTRRDNYGT